MHRHNTIAVTLASVAAASAAVDTVVLALSGHRTFVTDDERGTVFQSVLMSVFLGITFAALALVVAHERPAFSAGNRATRLMWRPLLAGLSLLALGGVVIHPAQLLTETDDGLLYNVSGLLAMIALALTFIPSLVLGLAGIRDNTLGLGGRVLRLVAPGLVLTAVLAALAPDYASPVYVTMLVLVGIALLGAVRSPDKTVIAARDLAEEGRP